MDKKGKGASSPNQGVPVGGLPMEPCWAPRSLSRHRWKNSAFFSFQFPDFRSSPQRGPLGLSHVPHALTRTFPVLVGRCWPTQDSACSPLPTNRCESSLHSLLHEGCCSLIWAHVAASIDTLIRLLLRCDGFSWRSGLQGWSEPKIP